MKLLTRLLLLPALVYTVAGCAGSTVGIETPDGKLVITALTDNSVRVQMAGNMAVPELEELVYTSKVKAPALKVEDSEDAVTISLKGIKVKYSKSADALTFYNAEGKVILQESSHDFSHHRALCR